MLVAACIVKRMPVDVLDCPVLVVVPYATAVMARSGVGASHARHGDARAALDG